LPLFTKFFAQLKLSSGLKKTVFWVNFPHGNPFFKVIDNFLSKMLKDNLSSNTIFYLLYDLHYQLKKSPETPETLEADM
jgi:hypothetical protein